MPPPPPHWVCGAGTYFSPVVARWVMCSIAPSCHHLPGCCLGTQFRLQLRNQVNFLNHPSAKLNPSSLYQEADILATSVPRRHRLANPLGFIMANMFFDIKMWSKLNVFPTIPSSNEKSNYLHHQIKLGWNKKHVQTACPDIMQDGDLEILNHSRNRTWRHSCYVKPKEVIYLGNFINLQTYNFTGNSQISAVTISNNELAVADK